MTIKGIRCECTLNFTFSGRFVKGDKEVTAMTRAKLRKHMVTNIFKAENAESVREEHISALFKKFDADGSGVITLDEFQEVFVGAGMEPDGEQLDLLVGARCLGTSSQPAKSTNQPTNLLNQPTN